MNKLITLLAFVGIIAGAMAQSSLQSMRSTCQSVSIRERDVRSIREAQAELRSNQCEQFDKTDSQCRSFCGGCYTTKQTALMGMCGKQVPCTQFWACHYDESSQSCKKMLTQVYLLCKWRQYAPFWHVQRFHISEHWLTHPISCHRPAFLLMRTTSFPVRLE